MDRTDTRHGPQAAGCLALHGGGADPPFHGPDPASQLHSLVLQLAADFPGEWRQIRVRVHDYGTEAQEIPAHDEAELAKLRPQCVDRLVRCFTNCSQDGPRLLSPACRLVPIGSI
ncbi:MAG: hypothetical protein H7245_25110 [Candidatus Saccharibacteria bacterium]|nr:hypothetical protein [Pseudorhodobacter sp.]